MQFIFYAVLVAGGVGALSETWGDLQRAAGASERLMELLHAEPDDRGAGQSAMRCRARRAARSRSAMSRSVIPRGPTPRR